MSKELKDFKFHIPVELVKGEGEAEEFWRVRGIASTSDQDLQGETIDQDGLDISVLKAGRGLFNVDHLKGPENIIGQIEDAEFVMHEGKKSLLVDGYLFKEQPKAQAFRNILKSLKKGASSRVHMSIEGKIIQRDPKDGATIKKARIDKVALTLDPVNPFTFVELCKSLNTPEPEVVQEQVVESTEEMVEISKKQLEILVDVAQKAMAAGIGYAGAPESRTGGSAMAKEDLDCKKKDVSSQKKKVKDKKKMVKSLIESLKAAYPTHDSWEIAGLAIEAFLEDETKGE